MIMWRVMALLSISIILASNQPVEAQDGFSIYVHGPGGEMVSGAQVDIYQSGSRIGGGPTDSSGVYWAPLSSWSNYEICAGYWGRSGCWRGSPSSSGNRIDIYLN